MHDSNKERVGGKNNFTDVNAAGIVSVSKVSSIVNLQMKTLDGGEDPSGWIVA